MIGVASFHEYEDNWNVPATANQRNGRCGQVLWLIIPIGATVQLEKPSGRGDHALNGKTVCCMI